MSEILENEISKIKSDQTGTLNLDKKKDKKGKKHKKDDEKSKLKAEKKRITKEYEKELSHLQIELLKLQY